jgi:hypothetical protein
MFSTVARASLVIENAAHHASPLSKRATGTSSSTPVDRRVEEAKSLQNSRIFFHSRGARQH